MPGSERTVARRLEGLLRGLTRRKPIVQTIVAVESGDRQFRWIGAEGMTASGGRVVEHTPFFIAGIDNLYNAAVTMMLSESVRRHATLTQTSC